MSYKLNITETWDGLPITKEKPYGITIVTFRRDESLTEYLVLHRVHRKKVQVIGGLGDPLPERDYRKRMFMNVLAGNLKKRLA